MDKGDCAEFIGIKPVGVKEMKTNSIPPLLVIWFLCSK